MTTILLELTALVGATVHADPGGAAAPATVLVEDGRVVAVGADVDVPEDAQVFDLGGLHLVPGLIDGMAHADPEHDLLHVAAGVLAICDHGNDLGRIFAHRRDAAGRVAPTILTAGAVIDGLPPATAEALVLTTAEDVDANLPTLLAEEPDFLAVHRNLGAEPWQRVLQLAAEHGLAVWGPRPAAVPLERFLGGGQRGVLSLEGVFLGGTTGWEAFDAAAAGGRVRAVADAGLAVVPLQQVLGRFATAMRDEAEDPLRLLGPQYRARWAAELAARRAAEAADETLVERERDALARRGALVERLHAAGATLVPGSGAPNPWLAPGTGLHDELAAWQRAGVPAAACLRAATAGAAEAFGLGAERGTIAPGRAADLLAVAGDPTADLAVLRRPEVVVLRGRVLRRAELDASLAALAAAQASAAVQRDVEARPPKLPEGDVLLRGTSTTSAVGARLSVESWAVVRDRDGLLVFAGRVVLPGTTERDDAVVQVRQRLKKGRLEDFHVTWRARGQEVVARGLLLGGNLRIERRLNGGFVDNRTTNARVVALDVGSVTTMLLLGHAREEEGGFSVLRFHEGLEWEAVPWRLELGPDGRHAFGTPGGPRLALFAADGSVQDLVEQRGSGFTRTFTADVEATAGGLPLPASKTPATEGATLLDPAR